MSDKEKIIELFYNNVKGKSVCLDGLNPEHDGNKGHWLETQFGIVHNSYNEADLYGYELKNQTDSKTTFGDWSANEYIYNNPLYFSIFNEKRTIERRDHFLKIFGKPNAEKNNRYSWSGEPCPKINYYNKFGQILKIDENNDIIVVYSYSNDMRENKNEIIPDILKQEKLVLAKWYGNSTPDGKRGKCLKKKVEDKFNDKGWFTCKMNGDGIYTEICFGNPINYDNWIELVKKGVVYFDSGMHELNPRPYSQWRADNNLWNSLIIEKYN